jgi:hypothetical protein
VTFVLQPINFPHFFAEMAPTGPRNVATGEAQRNPWGDVGFSQACPEGAEELWLRLRRAVFIRTTTHQLPSFFKEVETDDATTTLVPRLFVIVLVIVIVIEKNSSSVFI